MRVCAVLPPYEVFILFFIRYKSTHSNQKNTNDNYPHRVSRNCRQSSRTSFSDSNQTQLSLTPLEALTAARLSSHHHPTAHCLRKQHPGQQGGGKRLVPLGGEVPRVHPVVLVALVVPPAAAAVGGRLQQVGVGVPHGVEVLVLGHHRQRGDGVATQHLVVRGMQEAVLVGGGEAVQLEIPQAGVVRTHRHRAVGTCDGYYFTEAVPS